MSRLILQKANCYHQEVRNSCFLQYVLWNVFILFFKVLKENCQLLLAFQLQKSSTYPLSLKCVSVWVYCTHKYVHSCLSYDIRQQAWAILYHFQPFLKLGYRQLWEYLACYTGAELQTQVLMIIWVLLTNNPSFQPCKSTFLRLFK